MEMPKIFITLEFSGDKFVVFPIASDTNGEDRNIIYAQLSKFLLASNDPLLKGDIVLAWETGEEFLEITPPKFSKVSKESLQHSKEFQVAMTALRRPSTVC